MVDDCVRPIAKISDFALSKYIQIPHISYTPEDPKDRERSGREARRLWYRAPEILMRKPLYSQEIDMWAFGCIMAEMTINEPLFNGDSEIEQLFKIFRMIGSPNQQTFKQISDHSFKPIFPDWEQIKLSHFTYATQSFEFHNLKKVMTSHRENSFKKMKSIAQVLGRDGMELLEQCLNFDPQKRCSAEWALKHPFFSEFSN